MSWIEILGYGASILILISLSMKSFVKLRWLNAIGSLLFTVFAVLTKSYPTALVNFGIIIVDAYYLLKISKTKENFDVIPIGREDKMMAYFYGKNKREIEKLFGADVLENELMFAFFMRNNDIAGLLAYSLDPQGKACIYIDFVTQKYRDCAVGKYFFVMDLSFWKNQNINVLEVEQPDSSHIAYLERIGFTQQHNPSVWAKQI